MLKTKLKIKIKITSLVFPISTKPFLSIAKIKLKEEEDQMQ
jgi:hypothetical protein